jgi:hypothetical protein
VYHRKLEVARRPVDRFNSRHNQPQLMKKYLLALATAATLLLTNPSARADQYESLAISGASTPTTTIVLKKAQSITIHNFVDTNFSSQSTVSVTILGVTTTVLGATGSTVPETFKDLIVVGPATLTVTVGAAQFNFLTFKIGVN